MSSKLACLSRRLVAVEEGAADLAPLALAAHAQALQEGEVLFLRPGQALAAGTSIESSVSGKACLRRGLVAVEEGAADLAPLALAEHAQALEEG